MNNFFYTVIETQMNTDGSIANLCNSYTNESDAYARLYTILAAAAVSTLPYHSAHILRSDGVIINGQIFNRLTVSNEEIQ